MTDNLFTGDIAREGLMKGVRKIASAVGATMGTAGQNSLIECIERPGHYATNDGYSIANAIRLSDSLEEIGRGVLLEAINRANKSSGDGSSTTCVLTSAILEEGMKYVGQYSPMEIKRSLESLIPVIEESVKKQTKTIEVKDVAAVASISAEDEGIGKTIQEIYEKIGKDGIVHWDISKTADDSYTFGTGLTMSGATYVSPYMCDINDKGELTQEVRWKNPVVMLCRQKLSSSLDLNAILHGLYNKEKREVLIFCDDIEVPVVADLVRTRAVRGLKTVVVKMPILWRDEWWEDLSIASGAKIISSEGGVSLKDATEEHLGTFGNILITKDDTYIDGTQDLSKHILGLKVDGSDQALLRASRLNTQTARYFVGAHSDSALAYRRLKVEDAINAAACALEEGIVPGGGIALYNVSEELTDEEIGGKILKEALKAPFRQIVANTGSEAGEVGGTKVFDTRTLKVVDGFENGIIDPTSVVLNAMKNAIGVAASILTTGTVVMLPKINEELLSKIPR